MPRETIKARNARVGQLLASFDAHNREANKMRTLADAEKVLIKELESGDYGDWILTRGTPREVDDRAAITQHYVDLDIPKPKMLTDAPIIVSPKAGR